MIMNYHYSTRWIHKFTYPPLWTHNDIPTYPTNRVLLPTFNTLFLPSHTIILIYPYLQSSVKMSIQYTIYTSTYYVCVTIDNDNCEINISPWTDETPMVFPPMTLSTDEAYNSFMFHYNNDDNWKDIDNDIYYDDNYFSHASLQWTACLVRHCPDHPTYTKSYQAHNTPL